MAEFQRKGTVSKSSGPVHVNSYALKGVPIKYTPPFYLPDQLTIPPTWIQPTLPSDDIFRYDYTRERSVLEQVRVRTMSLAAEAQAREQREREEEERRRIEAAAAAERAKVTTSSAELPPPLIPSPGSTILTPTPAPRHTLTQTPPTNGTDSSVAANSKKSANILIKDSTNILKPLGEMSLSEFEDDNFNPFDSASLQAINDMEILQTISLAPITENPSSSTPRPNVSDGIDTDAGSSHAGENNVTESRPPVELSPNDPPLTAPPLTNAGVPAVTAPPTNACVPVVMDDVSRHSVQQIPQQFAGPRAVPPATSSPSSFLPASVITGSAPGAQLTRPLPPSNLPTSSPLSLPTLPVLPPIGANVTHSHSEPVNTNPPNNQPPLTPSNPLSDNPTPALYPLMTQGTITLPPPSSNPPPTSLSSSSPIVAGPHYPTLPQQPSSVPTFLLSQPLGQAVGQQAIGQQGLGQQAIGQQAVGQQAGVTPIGQQGLGQQPIGQVTTGQEGAGVGHPGSGVATLVHFGDEVSSPVSTAQQASTTQTPPVPKPRTIRPVGHQVPNSAQLPPYPSAGSATALPQPPVVAPKPSAARTTVQDRANSLLSSLPQGPARPGLGVAVLPPIPTDPQPSPRSQWKSVPSVPPTSAPPSLSSPPYPPPYFQQSPPERSHSPPPPYYPSQDGAETRRFSEPVSLSSQPSHFTLPDIQSSLSREEKTEVDSIAGMGFPAPRVARAVKRFNNDRTKVVDFLILVGIVEESTGGKGDSAEVALTVCDENDNKAKRYLQKVKYYKESGFSEGSIHEAYEKAGKDWDRALDFLTQDT